jgi:FMN reductase
VTVGVIVGNPKPASRTLAAAVHVAREITGAEPDLIIDVIELGPGLLRIGDPDIAQAVASVCSMDLIVVASPTYKATFTGVLKLFLDQFAGGALEGIVAVPLMLGAGPGHALAPEVFLKPVLAELGASTPTRALYLLESDWQTSKALAAWLPGATTIINRSLASAGRAR